MPATIPSTPKPVVTVDETLMLSNGKSPVRISQRPSKIIPRFLPAKLFVSAMRSSFLNRSIELNDSILRQTCRLNCDSVMEFSIKREIHRAHSGFTNLRADFIGPSRAPFVSVPFDRRDSNGDQIDSLEF